MKGQIRKHPLAELIREIAKAGLSGALRLSRERAKVAVYFEDGKLVFAASNLRSHRLWEVLKLSGLTVSQLGALSSKASDAELAAALIQDERLTPEALAGIRASQVSDVLRLALLWTEGAWEFDPRVRVADELRVQIDVNRLLLECARHLPCAFVKSRFDGTNGAYLSSADNDLPDLLSAEACVLSSASASSTFSELAARSGLKEEESLRAIYALSLSGLIERSDWPAAFTPDTLNAARGTRRTVPSALAPPRNTGTAVDATDKTADVQALFARLKTAKDLYEVLDVARRASMEEIKNAYHALARQFHPDRFHNRDPALRKRVDSAFARIAQAYETLSDKSLREDYDAKATPKSTGTAAQKAAGGEQNLRGAKQTAARSETNRAETSFRRGMEALQSNRHDEAIRLLAEAAMLAPREARYRAHYGHALSRQSNMRRIAEAELQAALSLDPENASYRVMLAELYHQLGLRRRAEGELAHALVTDPKNEAARLFLSSLKNK